MEMQILDPTAHIRILKDKAKQSINNINKMKPNDSINYLKNLLKQSKISKDNNPNPQVSQQDYREIEIIAHNNLACVCSKKGKLKQSLYHLQIVNNLQNQKHVRENAIDDIKIDGLLQLATTHSNMCAVYSKMQDRKKALEEIQLAISLIEKALEKAQTPNKIEEATNTLVIAFYNCSIEFQLLSNFAKSHSMAVKALSAIQKMRQDGYALRHKNIEGLLKENIKKLNQKMSQRAAKLNDYIKIWQKGIGTYQKVHQDQSMIFASRISNQRNNQNKNHLKGSPSAQISLHFRKSFDLDMKNRFAMNKKLYPQGKFYTQLKRHNSQFPQFNSNRYKIFQQKKSQVIKGQKKYDSEKVAEIQRKLQSQQSHRISIKSQQKRSHKQDLQCQKLYLE